MGTRTLYPLGSMEDQKRPFARGEGDLEKVKTGKWVELAEEALHRPPEADQE